MINTALSTKKKQKNSHNRKIIRTKSVVTYAYVVFVSFHTPFIVVNNRCTTPHHYHHHFVSFHLPHSCFHSVSLFRFRSHPAASASDSIAFACSFGFSHSVTFSSFHQSRSSQHPLNTPPTNQSINQSSVQLIMENRSFSNPAILSAFPPPL